nr:hypothetical protein CFP56_59911 [Quercus suber]
MEYKWSVLFTILAFILVLVNCIEYSSLNEPYNIGGSLLKPCPLCNTNRKPGPGSPGTQSCCDSSQGVELVVQGGRDVYNRPITQDPKQPAIGTNPGSKGKSTVYNRPGSCCHGAVRNMFSKQLHVYWYRVQLSNFGLSNG